MNHEQLTQIETKTYFSNLREGNRLLTPFQHKLLTKSLETGLCKEYRQRIEIMLLADQGYTQTQICKVLGCCQDTARYWIAIAQLGQAHQWNERRIGRPKVIDESYLNRLKELVSRSPREFDYSFGRWTAQWLSKHLAKETGIQTSDRHINRLLKTMGLSTRQNKSSEQANNCALNNSKFVIEDLSTSSNANCSSPFHLLNIGESFTPIFSSE
jgi:transposase